MSDSHKKKLRYVRTKFWDDPWISSLKIKERYLFLYLLTNPLTNVAGVYEITIKRIYSDTDLKKNEILEILKVFQKAKKVYYFKNHILINNYHKNQKLNPSIIISIKNILLGLPDDVFSFCAANNVLTGVIQSVPRLRQTGDRLRQTGDNLKLNIEAETEDEVEIEVEAKNTYIHLPQFPLIKITKEEILKIRIYLKKNNKEARKGSAIRDIFQSYNLKLENKQAAKSHKRHYKGIIDYLKRGFFDPEINRNRDFWYEED